MEGRRLFSNRFLRFTQGPVCHGPPEGRLEDGIAVSTYTSKQSAQQSASVAADRNNVRNQSTALHLTDNRPEAKHMPASQAMVDHRPSGQWLKTMQVVMAGSPGVRDQIQQMQALSGETGTASVTQTAQLSVTDTPSPPEPVVQAASDTKQSNKSLPDTLKRGVEALSGLATDNVKVDYNSPRPAQLNARAFGQEADIHGAPGQEQHVVQQAQGKSVESKPVALELPERNRDSEMDRTGPVALHRRGATPTPVQAVSFSRFLSRFSKTDAERKIIAKERDVRNFHEEMRKYAPRFPEITKLGEQLDTIHDTKITQDRMDSVLGQLNSIQNRLDAISTKIARTLMPSEEVMRAYTENTKDSKAGRIIQTIIDTIILLPDVFRSPNNEDEIIKALHPDDGKVGFRLNEDFDVNLGESDVTFALNRQKSIIQTLTKLEETIRENWDKLRDNFGLQGTLKHIELTGSDFHNGGQQVVIIHSSGGQKVVYKPRSLAADAALVDSQNSLFALLNSYGAKLQTMKTLAEKDEAGYAEFVQHQPEKTGEEIHDYYYRMGQLAVATKLLGVNDLHYENIMAAGPGPTIVDAETSFQLHVMAARTFSSTALNEGIYKYVSIKDLNTSNNFFYTATERDEWADDTNRSKPEWKYFIEKKRRGDLIGGGPYEKSFLAGIDDFVNIITKHSDEIIKRTADKVDNLECIRVVPVSTSIFKVFMSNYRVLSRSENQEDIKDIDLLVKECYKEVKKGLTKYGYNIDSEENIHKLIIDNFNSGDVPILHYNGKIKKLIWNKTEVGEFIEKISTPDQVKNNIDWIKNCKGEEIRDSLTK
jgi:hypothetical protein